MYIYIYIYKSQNGTTKKQSNHIENLNLAANYKHFFKFGHASKI